MRDQLARRSGLVQEADAIFEQILPVETLADLDRFDRVQLADVLQVCGEAQPCPMPAANCSPPPGKDERRRTTQIGCASTWDGSGWIGQGVGMGADGGFSNPGRWNITSSTATSSKDQTAAQGRSAVAAHPIRAWNKPRQT